jgi:predicted dehydrogenase
VSAEARLSSPNVDRWMAAEFRFTDGRTARMTCSLFSSSLLRVAARVLGDKGEMRVLNPFAPQFTHRLVVRTPDRTYRESLNSEPTYTHQLRAFVHAIRTDSTLPTEAGDGLANMQVIDAVYDKAGLPRRG